MLESFIFVLELIYGRVVIPNRAAYVLQKRGNLRINVTEKDYNRQTKNQSLPHKPLNIVL